MTSREAFEEYERMHYTQGLEMWGDNYKNTHVRCRWEGWQAATERAAPAQGEPVAFVNVQERKLEWNGPQEWNTSTVGTEPRIPLYATAPPAPTLTDEMDAVAIRYAHQMALDLECVLAEYGGSWYNTAMQTLSDYRMAMNAIHEREAPTFMGEPVVAVRGTT